MQYTVDMSAPAPTLTSTESLDRRVTDAINYAERRRAMLERLSAIGMAMAEEIGARAINSPYHPEPRHDPGRSFAAVSRAVRLTIVLEARVEAEIVAIRNGEATPFAAAPRAVPITPAFDSVSEASPFSMRVKVRDAVCEAIDHEIGDVDEARRALDRVHGRLIEGEDYDALLSRPWRDCVEAICADLGLNPDWSRWSDEEGFAPPEAGQRRDWPSFWAYDPGEADVRRRRRADRASSAEPALAAPGQGPP